MEAGYVPNYSLTTLMRKRCSTLNLTLFWISAPGGTHPLPWAISMLLLALRELATSYVLVLMALVPGTPTAVS